MVLSLSGYPYTCPDIIGGGEISSFLNNSLLLDQDLIVRSAQCLALMPMMQFSVAPWRILDSMHMNAIRECVKTRNKFSPLIVRLAKQSAQTGEPVVKPL